MKIDIDWNQHGITKAMQGDLAGALKCFLEYTQHEPKQAHGWSNAGNAYRLLGQHENARIALERALEIAPMHVDARYNLAMLHMGQNRLDEADRHLKYLHEFMPLNANVIVQRITVAQRAFDWETAQSLHADLWRVCEQASVLQESPLFMQAVYDDPALHACLSSLHGRAVMARMPPLSAEKDSGACLPRRKGRLRLGFLSSDFFSHATLFLIQDVLCAFDREQTQVFVYHHGAYCDTMTDTLRAGVEHFVHLHGMDRVQMARRIQGDELDVLIDLKGYTRDSAIELFAARLAPVQWHWLGYPGSLGIPAYVDAVIADSVVVPEGFEAMYPETVLRVPGCYQPSPRVRQPATPARWREKFDQDAVLLGNFNQGYKHTKSTVQAWLEILARCPKAVLCLLDDLSPQAHARLQNMARDRGVDVKRIVMMPKCAPSEHLGRLGLIDLIVDDSPYNGHTSTSDALWSGVPVVALTGKSFASRVSASLLQNVGLGELAVRDMNAYVELSCALVEDKPRRDQLRMSLLEQRQTSSLFDAKAFAAALQALAQQTI